MAALLTIAAHTAMGDAPVRVRPYIVNGTTTAAYPSTGALLMYTDASRTVLDGLCSGTLVGCRTFLTAAHCLCSDFSDNFASCRRDGITPPATLRVFFQHAGFFDVVAADVDPDYSFAEKGDVALVTLAAPVTGIAPSPLNLSARPIFGTHGTIVGFGTTLDGRNGTNDDGIKRQGTVVTAMCTTGIPDETHICWQFSGVDANTCGGDSGGPLFIDMGSGAVVAGVTSGGNSRNCGPPDVGFDSDVFVNHDWLETQSNGDLGDASCDLPAAGSTRAPVTADIGEITTATSAVQLSYAVPAGTARLRIVLNGQLTDAQGNDNDFDLYVRSGSLPTTTVFDCSDRNATALGSCEFAAPAAGVWHVLVNAVRGTGKFQVTTTAFMRDTTACAGDCNGDGVVTIDELITSVNVALGVADLQECPVVDANGDGAVTVDELIAAVASALNNCPAP